MHTSLHSFMKYSTSAIFLSLSCKSVHTGQKTSVRIRGIHTADGASDRDSDGGDCMRLRDITFKRVLCASGTRGFFGEGYWFHRWIPVLEKGLSETALVTKTATLCPRTGNMPLNDDYAPEERFSRFRKNRHGARNGPERNRSEQSRHHGTPENRKMAETQGTVLHFPCTRR